MSDTIGENFTWWTSPIAEGGGVLEPIIHHKCGITVLFIIISCFLSLMTTDFQKASAHISNSFIIKVNFAFMQRTKLRVIEIRI